MRITLLLVLAALLATEAEAQSKLKHTYLVTARVEGQGPEELRAQQLTAAIETKLKVTYGADGVEVREWPGAPGCRSLPNPDACDVVSLGHMDGEFPLLVEQVKTGGPKHGSVRELGNFKCTNRPFHECWVNAVRDSAAVIQRHHQVHVASGGK